MEWWLPPARTTLPPIPLDVCVQLRSAKFEPVPFLAISITLLSAFSAIGVLSIPTSHRFQHGEGWTHMRVVSLGAQDL